MYLQIEYQLAESEISFVPGNGEMEKSWSKV